MARGADPEVDVRERSGAELSASELTGLVSPSLFGGSRLVVIRAAQDLKTAAAEAIAALMQQPAAETTLVLQHASGAKGKAMLGAIRKAKPHEIECTRLTRADERVRFIRGEVRRAGGSITPDAAALVLDAVGSDLRELAIATAQLVGDSGGRIDAQIVAAYHRGRAEVTGFAVADRAVVGDVAGALETLRWALSIGVPHVVIADALADGVRSVARLAGTGQSHAYELAQQLGMPPWKVKRAQSQARGWSDEGLRRALIVVAELNADVKGAAADPSYAIERAIGQLRAARAACRRDARV